MLYISPCSAVLLTSQIHTYFLLSYASKVVLDESNYSKIKDDRTLALRIEIGRRRVNSDRRMRGSFSLFSVTLPSVTLRQLSQITPTTRFNQCPPAFPCSLSNPFTTTVQPYLTSQPVRTGGQHLAAFPCSVQDTQKAPKPNHWRVSTV